jgi:hypothetical protein
MRRPLVWWLRQRRRQPFHWLLIQCAMLVVAFGAGWLIHRVNLVFP